MAITGKPLLRGKTKQDNLGDKFTLLQLFGHRRQTPTKRTLQVRDLHDALRVIAVNEREHHAAIVQACPDLAFKVDCWQVEDLSRWEPERIIAHLEQECVSLLRSLRTRPIAAVALS